jgi:protein-S-isoprenylcysteine O-methyltransferase Ste14
MAPGPVYIFIGAWLWLFFKLYQGSDTRLHLAHWLRPADAALVSVPISVPLALFLASIVAWLTSLVQRGCLPASLKHWYIKMAGAAVPCAIFFKVVQMAEAELGGSLNGPVSQIVTSGVFAFSRNPVYLCGLLVWPLSASVGFDSVVAGLVLFGLMWPYLYFVVVPAEEQYLLSQFPEKFEQYAAQTSRWLL